MLKNAKDACATEALEIATYTALERLATPSATTRPRKLAASIRADEEQMLARVLREIPKLTDAVVGADSTATVVRPQRDRAPAKPVQGGRAQATRDKRAARQARKVPGVAKAEGQVKGAVASEDDLAIDRYGALTADEIVAPAAGALADRPGQGRRLRAPRREPHDGARPRHARCAATSRGPATTS